MANKRGFTLIEAVFSILVLGVFSVVIIDMIVSAMAASHSALLNNQAVAKAEAAIEQSRAYFQTNRWAGMASLPQGCYDSKQFATKGAFDPTTLLNPPNGTCPTQQNSDCSYNNVSADAAGFYAYTQLAISVPSSQATVQSIVGWRDGGKCRNEEVDTYFYNY